MKIKAIKVHQNGGPEVLKYEDIDIGNPGSGQVLVRLKAIGVNYVDINVRKDINAPQSVFPYIPGREGAGIVEVLGEGVTSVKVGDRVAFVHQSSTYAEACLVKAESLIPVPDDFSFEQAAAFPLQGLTAHYLLHEFRKVKPGEIVLIHAAAGGMGNLLVQWAHHMGATVIGTVSTEDKAKAAKEAGANEVINYAKQNFAIEVKRLTNGHGADLVIDGVGHATFWGSLESAAVRGNIVIFGAASGPAAPVMPNALMPRALTISGGSLGNFIASREELLRRAKDVIRGIQEGWLKLKIQALPLSKASEAHSLLENRKTTGKLVLVT